MKIPKIAPLLKAELLRRVGNGVLSAKRGFVESLKESKVKKEAK